MTLDIKVLNHFKLSYCMTAHSVQGLSIDDKVCIFDCNTPYVDRNYVWTAITRVRDLDNITYFEHPEHEVQRLCESKLKQYLKFKIDNYKKQDIEAKRNICQEKYINVDWLFNKIEKNEYCPLCHCKYYIALDEENNVRCNISVDRLDSEISHEKKNCHLLCIDCNRSRSNK